ncbi:MAG: glycoside hydrolase family 3 C-terminal domain-containing protein [Melioribacteraceae bacterium]|nr:glycoside hydrolase family 3 C-terminal domain-containing protein [Melioribacteraceae bacterium]
MNRVHSIRKNSLILISLIVILCPEYSNAQDVNERIEQLITNMTLEEKIKQLHKAGAMHTENNLRLNIPGFSMADGPHGVRDGLATSFPVGIGMAATWDVELAERVGIALGKEFRGKGKHQALGPAIDLTRDPRNGRTPESGGEDPYLNAMINTAMVKGMQNSGVIATAKHYNGKHKQVGRNSNDYKISQRNLLEHYGFNFRTLVQDAGVMSIMSAYNRVNGDQASESSNLLSTILRNKWGFPYYVVSDWGAVHNSEKAIKSGTDICMGSDQYENDLLNLVNSGLVPIRVIDDAVRRVLRTKIFAGMLDYLPLGDPSDVNSPAHQSLCLEAGKKSLVLLKNRSNILPLNKNTINKIALLGPNAAVMQTDGSGSSWVSPVYSVSPKQGIENYIGADKVLYAKGCEIGGTNYASDFAAAIQHAQKADLVIYFGGLDPSQEGEGFDRLNGSIELPGKQKDFISLLTQYNQKVIVVLISGGICGVSSFIDNIDALIYGFYPGQEGGNAIAQVLFGDYNPSGKLPVTLPKNDSQLPNEITDFDFNNDFGTGYRWFDEKSLIPQFAFGFGLSYTIFTYSNIRVNSNHTHIGNIIEVSVDVKNTGQIAGEEVVQLYLTENPSFVYKPKKELKGFKKIFLYPDEVKTVSFNITPNELYHFSQSSNSYEIDPGLYTAQIGGSSDNLPVKINFELRAQVPAPDLQVADIKIVPPYPLPGQKVSFYATIINRGIGPSPANAFHEVLFKVNGNTVARSVELTDSIPKGGMALVSGNYNLEGRNYWVADSPGEFTVEANVDDINSFKETIENNNSKSKTFRVFEHPPINFALNKNVTVSSFENSSLAGSNAVDGNYGSRWSSQFSDPQWLIIDLGQKTEFNQIRIYWETAYGKEYRIETSDDQSNWTAIINKQNGNGGVEKFDVNASARYLRIYGIKRATEWGYSIYEVEVFKIINTSNNDEARIIPIDFSLSNNYPNPFNPVTTIEYYVSKPGNVKLEVYNSLGQLVTTLENRYHTTGNYKLIWNGKNNYGEPVSSGIYFYRMDTEGFKLVKKMILMK